MDKQCFKCQETKPISEFYRHSEMADGHLGKCKTCTIRDAMEREQRLRGNHAWLLRERARCREKQARARKNGTASPVSLESQRKWFRENRHKKNAQLKAGRAAHSGKIPIKTACEHCGAKVKLHKHHPDYTKPLEVVFLCPSCHGKAHWKL